jgi:uncharacterized membrane protein
MGGFLRPRWFAPALAGLSAGWALAIGSAPVLADSSRVGAILAGLAYVAGSILCHQLPDRSFHVSGAQLPVCARCTGLYVGGALGAGAWLIWRHLLHNPPSAIDPKRAAYMVAIASAPTALTVMTAAAGIWDLSNAGRAALALPLGLAAGAVIAAFAANDLS